MCRTIHALFVISLFVAVTSAQIKEDDHKISPRDKAELQRLTKRFVARMQQTRDIKPLIPEFFIKDFDLLMGPETAFWINRDFDKAQLTRSQWLRMYVADVNLLYLYDLNNLMYGYEELLSILPPKLAITLKNIYDDNRGLTYTVWTVKLRAWERFFPMAKAELRRKNYERTAKYRKEITEKLKNDELNYFVHSDLLVRNGSDDDKDMANLFRRFPNGVRVFMVGTAVGVAPMYIKDHGRFMMLLVAAYPWD
jgi:hypothetical protein